MPFLVPKETMNTIPQHIKNHLPIKGQQLIVNRNLDLLDLFAGVARITNWAIKGGLNAIAMDKTYGDHMNMLDPKGLALTILLILRIKVGGLVAAGPQCSSWVWINRSVTKRTTAKPMGCTSIESVRDGNLVNKAMALICYICLQLNVDWLIEQPMSSLFFKTPMMKAISTTIPSVETIFVRLGSFGHMTAKPTTLMGHGRIMQHLKAENMKCKTANKKSDKPQAKAKAKAKTKTITKPAASLVKIENRKDGTKSITGIKSKLKESQVYPVKFALAICMGQWPSKF